MAKDLTSLKPTRVLEDCLTLRNLQDSNRAEEINAGVSEFISDLWIEIVKIIKKGDTDRRFIDASLRAAIDKVFPKLNRYVEDELEKYTTRSFESCWDSFAASMPESMWWYYNEPADVKLIEAKLPWEGNKKRVDVTRHSRLKSIPGVKARKPGKDDYPSQEDLRDLIQSDRWKARMDRWSKLITDKYKVSELIADGLNKQMTNDEIAKRIMPHVQSVSSSAKRIVRTEAARISNEITEKKFEEYGDAIVAFRIVAVLDDATRPSHRHRDGNVYWKKPKRGQLDAAGRPKLPDEPNCRCTYTAVFEDEETFSQKKEVFIIKKMTDAEILAMTPDQVKSLPPGKRARYEERLKRIQKKGTNPPPNPPTPTPAPPAPTPAPAPAPAPAKKVVVDSQYYKPKISRVSEATRDKLSASYKEALDDLAERCPSVFKRLDSNKVKLRLIQSGKHSRYGGQARGIRGKPEWQLEVWRRDEDRIGWDLAMPGEWLTTKGTTGTFIHELGHVVHLSSHPTFDSLNNDISKAYYSQPKAYWSRYVSRYGSSNEMELFAESFARYMHPKYTKGELPPEIESLMEKHFPLVSKSTKPTPKSTSPGIVGFNPRSIKIRGLSDQEILALTPDQVAKLSKSKQDVYYGRIKKLKPGYTRPILPVAGPGQNAPAP